jgi:hypothetical protein
VLEEEIDSDFLLSLISNRYDSKKGAARFCELPVRTSCLLGLADYSAEGAKMTGLRWRQVPVGLRVQQWLTREARKIVVVAAQAMVLAQRLMEVVRLIETDHWIQPVFGKAE